MLIRVAAKKATEAEASSEFKFCPYCGGRLAARAVKREPISPELTDRQKSVLELVVDGLTSKVIAKKLNLSPRTVEFHRMRALEKLGVKNIRELTAYMLAKRLTGSHVKSLPSHPTRKSLPSKS
jgi:DNA-binding NarL/FixJ family response regulator